MYDWSELVGPGLFIGEVVSCSVHLRDKCKGDEMWWTHRQSTCECTEGAQVQERILTVGTLQSTNTSSLSLKNLCAIAKGRGTQRNVGASIMASLSQPGITFTVPPNVGMLLVCFSNEWDIWAGITHAVSTRVHTHVHVVLDQLPYSLKPVLI